MKKRYLLSAIALTASTLLMPCVASAQDFPPKRPVTLFVGFAPGGAADAAARLIAKKLTENIGQNVIVENKAGAGGNIVHQQVANGVADGSVILLGSIGPMTIAPHMMKMGFEPFKDLAPISGGVNFPNMLVVNKESGIKNLADFVAMAKKAPSHWRIVCHSHQHRDAACPLQGRCPCYARPVGQSLHRLFFCTAHLHSARRVWQVGGHCHHRPHSS
jgi:tripartite-type tricarboxylate transporter receptor subunit TctC